MSRMAKEVVVPGIDVATSHVERREDIVAKEITLDVFRSTIHFVSIFCLPTLLKELVVGHLLSEGLVNSSSEQISN